MPHNFFVYADGMAVDSKQLLLQRVKAANFDDIASPIAGDISQVDCPLSKNGSLDTAELYTDPKDNNRRYYLPTYQFAKIQSDTPPHKRYQVSLEFINDAGAKAIARLKVNLAGRSTANQQDDPTAPVKIRFDQLPDGTPIRADHFLKGDEFLAAGIRLAGAPESSYCSGATATAIRTAGAYGIPFPFLTSVTPGQINHCNGIPVAITFTQPVQKVALTFAGASVAYTMNAYDSTGRLLGTVQEEAVFQGGTFNIAFTSTAANISKVTFGHQTALTVIQEIRYRRTTENPVELLPLPHDVTVSLQYLLSEKGNGAAGVSTWKTIEFDEVVQKDETKIEATLHLYSLAELDTIYSVMSNENHQCRLVVQCQAKLAYRALKQVYVHRPLMEAEPLVKTDFSQLKLEVLPTAKPTIADVTQKGTVNFNYRTAFDAIKTRPIKDITVPQVDDSAVIRPQPMTPSAPFSPVRRPDLISPHLNPGLFQMRGSELSLRGSSPASAEENPAVSSNISIRSAALARRLVPLSQMVTHTEFNLLQDRLRPYAVDLPRAEFKLPSHYYTDLQGRPAYVTVTASYDQKISFYFPPAIHSYIYPNHQPAGEIALVRHQISGDQAIYQDTSQFSLFYYLPDEFRLTRQEVAPYRPALQVAFYTLSAQTDSGAGADGQTEYIVEFTFKAIPHIRPDRRRTALDYIQRNKLVPEGVVPSLAPLIPEAARLLLTLPKEAGGTEVVERDQADIALPHHIVDSLSLSAKLFSEIFYSMNATGQVLNGMLQVKLPGRPEEQPIVFSGDLNKMLGPITEQMLLGKVEGDETAYRVNLKNPIESSITLNEAVVYLLADPEDDGWVPAVIEAGTLPLQLKPEEAREIIVRPTGSIANAWGVRLQPVNAKVDLDFAALWRSVMETPGWNDITHQVTVTVTEDYFNGPQALGKVIVVFNHQEASVELTKGALAATVELTKPILDYLLRSEEADDYFYVVESWRNQQLVAKSNIQTDDSQTLAINPPLG